MTDTTPTIGRIWREIQARLEAAREVGPREGRQLVQHVLGLDDNGLIMAENREFPVAKMGELEGLVGRRLGGEPLAYVLGFAWFYGRKWRVTPDVLIPRPDTEVLVEAVLARLEAGFEVVEVGVGSGCIGGTLLAERADITLLGIDIDAAAAAVALENMRTYVAPERQQGGIDVVVRDGMDGIVRKFNLLVSNPPYIADAEWETLEDEVKDFEPRTALTGREANPDGLLFYRRLAGWGRDRLVQGGWLCVEVGWQQAQAVRELLEELREEQTEQSGHVWCEISITKDLSGRERVVCARRC